jgi:hypothetical protein
VVDSRDNYRVRRPALMTTQLLTLIGIAAALLVFVRAFTQLVGVEGGLGGVIFNTVWNAVYDVVSMAAMVLVAWAAAQYVGVLPAWLG